MGSTQSRQTTESPANEKVVQAPLEQVVEEFSAFTIGKPASADGSLTHNELKEWEHEASKNPTVSLARTILNHTDIPTALLSRDVKVADAHVFNTRLPYSTTPITNQLSSGRCWLFASTNVIRYDIMQKLKLKDFQLSQSYLFFYDKLEKSNYFFELAIEHADLPLEDRLINHLFSDPIGDGGQLDMAINLLERYGVVPQSLYPESYSSSASSKLNRLLTAKLRQHAIGLRDMVNSLRSSESLNGLTEEARMGVIINSARKKKEECMAEIYRVLTITLGVPPKASEKFTWEYYDADDKYHSYTGTPVEFYNQHRNKDYSLLDSFSLINDPRNPYSALYTVSKLGNVWGGRPVTYVNTESQKLKEAVVASIKASHPVFFGCDVGQFSHSGVGIMDLDIYDYKDGFGVTFGMTKAQRLRTGESAMTHAMVITAVHLDSEGRPVRYRVENSWGPNGGDHGYFVMSDAWFDQFVYQVVIPRKLASAEHIKVLDGGNPTVYAPWDPMGTLA